MGHTSILELQEYFEQVNSLYQATFFPDNSTPKLWWENSEELDQIKDGCLVAIRGPQSQLFPRYFIGLVEGVDTGSDGKKSTVSIRYIDNSSPEDSINISLNDLLNNNHSPNIRHTQLSIRDVFPLHEEKEDCIQKEFRDRCKLINDSTVTPDKNVL